MVLAQQADRLDARGVDYLRRIERGAARMSRLIEDLLDLSRISRQRIDRAEVDLSRIAEVAVAELREGAPDRTVGVEIAPGMTAVADPGLIEIALSNLLANAWKFTARADAGRIRFGSTAREGRTVFFVEDNGVGFDPAYASQLFQPFHRLHAEREFSGTGIGLALVERVVSRHGGRVWAEGRPGAGATFFFTLADERVSGEQ
jgi:signal transduction histidine kinase